MSSRGHQLSRCTRQCINFSIYLLLGTLDDLRVEVFTLNLLQTGNRIPCGYDITFLLVPLCNLTRNA